MKIPVLFYLSLFFQIVTTFVGGFYYKNLPRPMRILEWLIIIGLVDVMLQWTLAYLNIRNLWTSHFYTVIEIVFVVSIYSSWINKKQNRLTLWLCLAAFSIFWIIGKVTFEPLSLLNNWTAAISKILQIIFSAFILVDVVKESDIVWTDDPRLWVVAGIIIYSAGSLLISVFFNMMLHDSYDRLRLVMSINWILIIVSYLFYTRAFLCKR
jgi:hypothetical protein